MKTWFVRLVAVSVFAQAVFNGGRVLLSYRVLAFGGDAELIGWFTAVFSLMPLLIALPAGRRADTGHAPGVMRLGLIATLIAPVVMAASTGLWMLLAGYAALGCAHMLTLIAAQGMVAHLRSTARGMDSLFAYFTLGISAGQLFGIIFSGWIAAQHQGEQVVDTTPALIALVGLAALTVVLGWRHAGAFRRYVRAEEKTADTPDHEGALSILKHRGMSSAMFAAITVIVAIDLLTAYMPVLGAELGLSVGAVTMILAARSGFAMISRAFMPRITASLPRDMVLIVSIVVGAAALVAMPWLTTAVALTCATAVCGFTWGLVMPMTMTWVSSLVHEQDRALALSVRLMGNRLAQVVLPPVAGIGAGVIGAGSVFAMSGILMACAGATTVLAKKQGTLTR
ncbi:MFS transporter [Corynebacterium sp. TAE3-ERU12]|uniref:MFS transporter n=1 Tax=Corynebacterium sp. TAE3-ERU12 TaxID=2849491 RepID=UPI001C45A2C7|nr:MFS transporter [Corynebacterium sp. TAE3-ERU12]MBV7294309.1 MFS transporter [Corynebacterium sp. TAE3-ERU12]